MKHFRQIEAENTKAKLELVSNSTTLEMLTMTGMKSDVILSVVDRNVAIFTNRHAITHYELQISQGKLQQNNIICLHSAFPNKVRLFLLLFLATFRATIGSAVSQQTLRTVVYLQEFKMAMKKRRSTTKIKSQLRAFLQLCFWTALKTN